jgi:outer membrane biosynthesis protein TonB
MRTALFLVPYLVSLSLALPAFAQLGPAGVPGAPGLAPPEPEPEQTQPQPAPPPEPIQPPPAPPPPEPVAPEVSRPSVKKPRPAPKLPAACAKAKNVERCIARQERKRQANAACKGKKGKSFDQCVSNYLNRRFQSTSGRTGRQDTEGVIPFSNRL